MCVQKEIRAVYLLDRCGTSVEDGTEFSSSTSAVSVLSWRQFFVIHVLSLPSIRVMALLILNADVGLSVSAPLRVSCGNLQTLLF